MRTLMPAYIAASWLDPTRKARRPNWARVMVKSRTITMAAIHRMALGSPRPPKPIQRRAAATAIPTRAVPAKDFKGRRATVVRGGPMLAVGRPGREGENRHDEQHRHGGGHPALRQRRVLRADRADGRGVRPGQPEAPPQKQAAKGNHEGGNGEPRDDEALDEADRGARGHGRQNAWHHPPAGHLARGGDEARQERHAADRQVDLAHDDEDGHARRGDGDGRRLADQQRRVSGRDEDAVGGHLEVQDHEQRGNEQDRRAHGDQAQDERAAAAPKPKSGLHL